ncbi:Serine/threonine phosphatase stp [Maioricimonas rarisocia]|uniref:Serine/threonine phosphatase stp n=1 Tax=Maioricimonas rarisocia TaxID=2528026 RepID=A0A517ZC77_9PLAN|nr:protein phosphatase 2C domain-containing protein [Maioricimonas rarisocia]QDU40106.1 Serine/threonine phosphatase stp [Maioricimonas rarisocia]
MSRHDDDTVEISRPESFSDKFFAPPTPRFEVRAAGGTHVGKVRKNNEDNYAVVRRTRSQEVLDTSLPSKPVTPLIDEGYALIVADGIGGSAFGEFASRLAVETMFELAGRATSWVMRMTELDDQQIRERVAAYAAEIQKVFRGYSEINPDMAHMGTTWTSACIIPPDAVIVHIGDSRAFLYRDQKLERLTRDHTLGQEMAEAGMPDDEVQRYRHILVNSLQGTADEITADVSHVRLQVGDRLLVCSDGLTDMVDEDAIAQILQSQTEPQPTCDRLIESALEAGGRDNVTVVLCHIASAE